MSEKMSMRHVCDLFSKKGGIFFLLFIFLLNFVKPTYADTISSNPAAVNITPGNGAAQQFLEKKLGIQNDHGIHFDGILLGDINDLFSGGISNAERWTSNTSLTLGLTVDTKKLINWQGGLFGAQFLQFNGQTTNEEAGSVQGYNSITGPRPLNRSELYQLWFRQELFAKKLVIRIGKVASTFDFNNIIKPVPLNEDSVSIPAVTGLIYTPIFVNSSMLGVIPGYYNTAYGITISFIPIKQWYVSLGSYDGHLAQGVQTGLTGPHFNGSYFDIGETGFTWLLGKNNLPGMFALGAWHQTGLISNPSELSEHGASGYYFFGSQRVWYRHPNIDNSGISAFYQFGANNSSVLPLPQYAGGGFTVFGLIPNRMDDTMGLGVALGWLNQNIFNRQTESIYQAYYQAECMKGIYLEPVLSYIPTPGLDSHLNASWAGTVRLILQF